MAIAIVGLGAGVPLNDVITVGAHGFIYTFVGIGLTYIAGYIFGCLYRVEKQTSLLVSSGTAICGGSAIAAVSRVINARADAMAVSLGCVFLLNALALFVFPPIGHALNLSQTQFGLWAGLAIHDTSSVVGAALQYGAEATRIATTTKLARALWIVPIAIVVGYLESKNGAGKVPIAAIIKRCWFIGGFLLMAVLATYTPISQISPYIVAAAKHVMTLVLFMIGLGMTRTLIKQVGLKPFLQAFCLWLVVSFLTLVAVMYGIISV